MQLALALMPLVACTAITGSDPTPTTPPDETTATDVPVEEDWGYGGYLIPPMSWEGDPRYSAGFSAYVAAFPVRGTYPGTDFQSGLFGTWLGPLRDTEIPEYCTIEGGLGWWGNTKFGIDAPKFIMGGVAPDFSAWANGPLAGGFDQNDFESEDALGKFGAAQLSRHVLFPPDGLNLDPATNGELFGYGYHPLPLMEPQPDASPPTGGHSWTLFLDTANAKGPIAFFLPNHWTQASQGTPDLDGQFFDATGSEPDSPWALEIGGSPAAMAETADGVRYMKTIPFRFPATDQDSSVVMDRVSNHSSEALADAVRAWFEGGPATAGAFATEGTQARSFLTDEGMDNSHHSYDTVEGIDIEYPVNWEGVGQVDGSDPNVLRYRWNLSLVAQEGASFVLPAYFRLDTVDGTQTWTPILEGDVPMASLRAHTFPGIGERSNETESYVTPQEGDTVFTNPGPAAGPFETDLGDGSTVTYHWYRFVDQPAIVFWDLSDAHRAALQARVELLHANWDIDDAYLPGPSQGTLASLDEGLLVTPPKGLEGGYVPIVTRQELTRE